MAIASGQVTLADVNDGVALYTWVRYADTATGDGMSDSPTGKKYIGLAYNKTTITPSSNPSDYAWALIQGEQGVAGAKGADGQTYYTWIKYADDVNGNGMSDSPTDKRYLGLAHNKTTATESTNPADYMWSPLYDNVKVGGRNLLRDSQTSVTNSTYAMKDYTLAEPIANGETVTISLKGTLGADRTSFGIYNSGGSVSLATLTPAKQDSNGVFKQTFTWNIGSSSNTFLRVYQMTSSGTSSSTIQWIQLERGNVASDYTVANEDVKSSIDSASSTATTAKNRTDNWIMTGKTTIDGGKIEADTITSAQIQAGSITANELSVDELSAVSANLGNVTAGQINGISFTSPDVVKEDGLGRTWTTGVSIANLYNAFMTTAQVDPSTNGGYIAYQDVRIDYDGIMMWSRDDWQGMNTIVSYTGSGIFFDGSTSYYDPDGGQHNLRSAQNMYVHGERGLYLSAGSGKNITADNQIVAPQLHLTSTSDASGTSTNHGLTIGSLTSTHIKIDNNEVSGFSGSNVSSLNLNPDGGPVQFGYSLGGTNRFVIENGYIRQDDMLSPSLQNGWYDYGGSWQISGYWKDKNGYVHMEGLIRGGTQSSGTTLCTLPSGYRPMSTQIHIVMSDGSPCRINISSSGNVTLGQTISGTWVSFTGIRFKAEN